MRSTIVRTKEIVVACDVVNDWTVVEIDGELDIHTHALIRQAPAARGGTPRLRP